MAALPPRFLDQLVAECCQILGLEDANKVLKDTDPVVKLCARSAYSQVKKFCRRPFHKGSRKDYYPEYHGPLELRSLPLVYDTTQTPPVLLLTVTVDGVAEDDENVTLLDDNRLMLRELEGETQAPQLEDIVVTSTSGYLLAEENDTLYTALLLQTVANYHRKDSLGLREVAGEKEISRTPADSGELIESAKQVLEGLVYHGQGTLVGLED